MNVLIACEESQRVCTAFRERGHRAFSCDIQPCSGGHPEWHILGDVLPILDGDCDFITEAGGRHSQNGRWDLIIAHPPCTYLSVAGNRWFDFNKYGLKAAERYVNRMEAVEFFMKFVRADCKKIAIENPIGYMNTHYRKPDCIVYPWMFGESNNKNVCLWLKNLPALVSTKIVERAPVHRYPCGSTNSIGWGEKSAKDRAKTFPGIARAMAEQWG